MTRPNLPPVPQQVADFLLSEDGAVTYGLNKLDFTLARVRVDPTGYREIGHKIRQGAIEVREVAPRPGSATRAVYTPAMNRLSVPAGLDLVTPGSAQIAAQATIVHEATHALLDYHRFTTSVALDEAAAYVAEQIYAMARHRRQGSSDARAQAILSAAQAVVRGRDMLSRQGVVLFETDPDVEALVQAVRGHTGAYPNADERVTPDGIWGGIADPWYLPRGGNSRAPS